MRVRTAERWRRLFIVVPTENDRGAVENCWEVCENKNVIL